MTLLLIAIVLWPYVVVSVPTGHVGVLWYRIIGFDPYCMCFFRGTVLDPRDIREEGLHLIMPWNKLYLYDLRLQSTTQTYNAISKDGVSMSVQVSIRYQLQHNSVAVLHKFIGPDYFATVISPEIGSQTRQVIAQYTAEEVYTSREAIQAEIHDSGQKALGASLNKLVQPEAMEQPDPKHYNDFLQSAIQLLDTLVLSIELPPAIVAAINRQTEQYYQIQEYKFRVEREAQESKRKQIEANGIAAFQRTVSQGISEFVSALARHRGDAGAGAIAQCENRHLRHQQGWPAAHSRQCRHACRFGDNAAAAGKRRGTAVRSAAGPERQVVVGRAGARRRIERCRQGRPSDRQCAAGIRHRDARRIGSLRHVRFRGHSVPALLPLPRAGFRSAAEAGAAPKQ